MAPMADGSTWTVVDLFTPLEQKIVPVGPLEAERMFLARYQELTNASV